MYIKKTLFLLKESIIFIDKVLEIIDVLFVPMFVSILGFPASVAKCFINNSQLIKSSHPYLQ